MQPHFTPRRVWSTGGWRWYTFMIFTGWARRRNSYTHFHLTFKAQSTEKWFFSEDLKESLDAKMAHPHKHYAALPHNSYNHLISAVQFLGNLPSHSILWLPASSRLLLWPVPWLPLSLPPSHPALLPRTPLHLNVRHNKSKEGGFLRPGNWILCTPQSLSAMRHWGEGTVLEGCCWSIARDQPPRNGCLEKQCNCRSSSSFLSSMEWRLKFIGKTYD